MNEQNIFIVRCGEVALKGMNKPYFERMLVDRIRSNVKGLGNVVIFKSIIQHCCDDFLWLQRMDSMKRNE